MALLPRKKKNGLEEKAAANKRRLLAISAAARVQEKIDPPSEAARADKSSSTPVARHGLTAVSYTHLTLPTNREV